MKSPGPQRGSPTRYIIGMVCLISSLVMMPAGFIQMVVSLERGGYGTSAVTHSYYWMGIGGGLLGLGMVLLIWELSLRHNIRH